VAYYQTLGLEVHGVVSPPVYHQGKKVGIKVRDIHSGQEKYLAAKRPVTLPHMNEELGFVFDDSAVDWGRSVLRASVPTEVFIVDEIGPLELKQNKGWKEAVGLIMLQQYTLGIVVLRQSLHEMVREKWKVTEWMEYSDGLAVTAFDHYFHRKKA
jgi:nucleoside-triphosphatase THEP1